MKLETESLLGRRNGKTANVEGQGLGGMERMLDFVPKDLGLCLCPADSKPETENGNVTFSELLCSSNEIMLYECTL